MVFENEVKNIQAAAYNGARTVCVLLKKSELQDTGKKIAELVKPYYELFHQFCKF